MTATNGPPAFMLCFPRAFKRRARFVLPDSQGAQIAQHADNLIYHDTSQLPCTSQYSDSFQRFYPIANLPAARDYGTINAMYIAVMSKQRKEKMTLNQEPFVSADEAAKFLGIKRRFLLSLARRGIAGAYALGTGGIRKIWVFRLSELADAIDSKRYHLIHGSPR
ncbi:MAG: helix-turn-helix domain-containing protein [Terracidiphilus sp.]